MDVPDEVVTVSLLTSRLPGSIGAEEAGHTTGLDDEGDIIDGNRLAVALGEVPAVPRSLFFCPSMLLVLKPECAEGLRRDCRGDEVPTSATPQRYGSPASGPGRRLTSKTQAHRRRDQK
jgi:hypothetical protein